MTTASLTIQYVNDAKEGWKNGSIKDKDGNFWSIKADDVAFYKGREGETINVVYETYKKKDGTQGRAIVGEKKAANGAHEPVPAKPGNGHEKDAMISALALYNHTVSFVMAPQDRIPDHTIMGDFLAECMLAVDWAKKKYEARIRAPAKPERALIGVTGPREFYDSVADLGDTL